MPLVRRRLLALAACIAVATFTLPGFARSQAYPARPITLVVPFAAGGPTDIVARILGERMATGLGQPVIVENVTGADGVLGVGRVVRSQPDGYTISIGMVGRTYSMGPSTRCHTTSSKTSYRLRSFQATLTF
jgi:tripartite-type tricarboxylate transporter receptor subunit TctC